MYLRENVDHFEEIPEASKIAASPFIVALKGCPILLLVLQSNEIIPSVSPVPSITIVASEVNVPPSLVSFNLGALYVLSLTVHPKALSVVYVKVSSSEKVAL